MQPSLRHPPPFLLMVGRDPAWSLLSAGLAGMGAAVFLLAISLHWGAAVWWALPLVPMMAASWWRWALPSEQRLRWDGQAWQLQACAEDEIAVQVVPAIDLDAWLLLRLVSPGWRSAVAPHYVALCRSRHATQWGLLRASLYAERASPKA